MTREMTKGKVAKNVFKAMLGNERLERKMSLKVSAPAHCLPMRGHGFSAETTVMLSIKVLLEKLKRKQTLLQRAWKQNRQDKNSLS